MTTYAESLDLAVYGAQRLERLALRLNEAGDLRLRRKMQAALRDSGKAMVRAEQDAALRLPAAKYEVGLRESIAAAITVRTQTSANRAGVRVMVNRSRMPAGKANLPTLMNRGRWRHPVFGNREIWVEQTSDRGWWTTTGRAMYPQVQENMMTVLRETAAQITGG